MVDEASILNQHVLVIIDIDDFLEEEIHGPADFECTDDNKCVFQGMSPLNLSTPR
jgi:hypothetical protein